MRLRLTKRRLRLAADRSPPIEGRERLGTEPCELPVAAAERDSAPSAGGLTATASAAAEPFNSAMRRLGGELAAAPALPEQLDLRGNSRRYEGLAQAVQAGSVG